MSTTSQGKRGVQALNETLHAIFAGRDDVVLFGEDVLDPGLFVGVIDNVNGTAPRLDDELWVRTVYGVATAIQHGRAAIDHMADMFVPLYMWRAAAFMSETQPEPPSDACRSV